MYNKDLKLPVNFLMTFSSQGGVLLGICYLICPQVHALHSSSVGNQILQMFWDLCHLRSAQTGSHCTVPIHRKGMVS